MSTKKEQKEKILKKLESDEFLEKLVKQIFLDEEMQEIAETPIPHQTKFEFSDIYYGAVRIDPKYVTNPDNNDERWLPTTLIIQAINEMSNEDLVITSKSILEKTEMENIQLDRDVIAKMAREGSTEILILIVNSFPFPLYRKYRESVGN